MRLAWPIVKRHFHSILTNQGLGERLSRAESTEALQELRADAAKIAKKIDNETDKSNDEGVE